MLQVEEVRATLPLVEGGSLKDIFSNAGKEKNFHRACLGTSSPPLAYGNAQSVDPALATSPPRLLQPDDAGALSLAPLLLAMSSY